MIDVLRRFGGEPELVRRFFQGAGWEGEDRVRLLIWLGAMY